MKSYIVIPFFSLMITACSAPVAELDDQTLCKRLAEGEFYKNNLIWEPAFKEFEQRRQQGTISIDECKAIREKEKAIFAEKRTEESMPVD
ncbi:hypothetical protein [Serratia aquatilis]|uniref:Lipoprotein n=1 Tax=Serratia aquatilis TaxID=1737515 RepID=A0ABV6E865_9GAMM